MKENIKIIYGSVKSDKTEKLLNEILEFGKENKDKCILIIDSEGVIRNRILSNKNYLKELDINKVYSYIYKEKDYKKIISYIVINGLINENELGLIVINNFKDSKDYLKELYNYIKIYTNKDNIRLICTKQLPRTYINEKEKEKI